MFVACCCLLFVVVPYCLFVFFRRSLMVVFYWFVVFCLSLLFVGVVCRCCLSVLFVGVGCCCSCLLLVFVWLLSAVRCFLVIVVGFLLFVVLVLRRVSCFFVA